MYPWPQIPALVWLLLGRLAVLEVQELEQLAQPTARVAFHLQHVQLSHGAVPAAPTLVLKHVAAACGGFAILNLRVRAASRRKGGRRLGHVRSALHTTPRRRAAGW